MSQPDPRAAVLRAAGHSEAADLLEALGALNAQPQAEEAEQQEPAPAAPVDPRRAEGEAILKALQKMEESRPTSASIPAFDGPSQ